MVLSLAACDSCKGGGEEKPDESGKTGTEQKPETTTQPAKTGTTPTQPSSAGGQKLAFTVEGGELNGKAFDIQVADTIGYWLYDPTGHNTMIAARGQQNGYDVYFYAALPMDKPGSYMFKAGPSGADTRVQIRMRKEGSDKAFAYLASEGQITLNKTMEDWLQGTFYGKFVRSEKMGADLPNIPKDKRTFVKITKGSFAVTWKDRMGGKAKRWPSSPAPAKAPSK